MAVVACGSASAASGGARGHAPQRLGTVLSSAKSLAAVVDRPLPGRNLYQLTDELKLHSTVPIRKVLRTTSPNFPVGHRSSFHVLSEDSNNYFTMHATIRAETPHFYIYVQNGIKVNEAALKRAAHTFEYHIYPTDRSVYGSEWRPGVDGDPHITCLIGNMKSSITAGAFSAEDEYPRAVFPYTNAREMFYINTNTMPGDGTFDQTLAHEFQHMIHFHMHPRDSGWMNEGMSELAEHINGYSLNGEPQTFVADPQTQLDTWDTNPYSDNFNHYGAAYLYMSYIYTQFGRGMIRDLVAARRYTDFDLVNHVLRQRHIGLTADDVFGRWAVANWLNDPSVARGIYAYPELPKTIQHATSEGSSFSLKSTLTPFTAKYVDITPGKRPLHLSFSAPPTTQVYSFPYSGAFWWSGRGDLSDTRLARTVDLTHVKHAHLRYKLWYEIEKDYDFGYVEASTDGGKTWTAMPATHTSKGNPFGMSYGPGYTGQKHAWLNESVDLSRYAGKRIKVRFEYITDDGVNFQGMAIRDIRIPEIGFKDHYTGWSDRGFVSVRHNAELNQWRVELIEYTGHGVHVARLPLSASMKGAVTLNSAKKRVTRVVAVVFSDAPKTTAGASFTLSAGR